VILSARGFASNVAFFVDKVFHGEKQCIFVNLNVAFEGEQADTPGTVRRTRTKSGYGSLTAFSVS
jgi:hypothetical protein